MTNNTPETLAKLKAEAQSQFKMAAGVPHQEGIAFLMDNGVIVGGHSVAKFGKIPARTAAADALLFLRDVFGAEAMEDQSLRTGQRIIGVALATAVTERAAKLKKPTPACLADLGAYKGFTPPQTISVVSGNSLESAYEFIFVPLR